MEGYDEVSTHAKGRYVVALFHAKRVALAHLYLVRGQYVIRCMGMAIYADTTRIVVKEKAARQMRLFQSVPSKFAKEVTDIL